MRRLLCVLLTIAAGVASHLAHAKAYKGAEIYSNESYLYGRYEIRMRVANASGVLSTFLLTKTARKLALHFGKKLT